MSAPSILFDAPGPRTVRRHRLYTLLGVVLLLLVIGFVLQRLYVAGTFAYDQWEVFITPRFIEVILVDGVLATLKMAAAAVALSVVVGLVLGVAKLADRAWIRVPATVVVEFFRAVPVLLLMILFFFTFGINSGQSGAFWSVVLALTLYNGSVLAEIFRAGINAVPQGQSEAAYALGMRKTQVTNLVLLPQAVKIMLPAIISQCVVALKDTSLGYAVASPGLTRVTSQIYQQFGNQVAAIAVTAALYILMCVALTLLATWVQKRYVGERNPIDGAVGGPGAA
ncbi:amino acid ABC transporter permease [Nocardioides aurantiacus]|uniref:Glutamate transport system permease protein n=1 Tax=Nocardioides aurantiacus TaxID=86796 RepID=A0A3N2CRE3_9ACTN|nr:amino acid ABC transporter permease [Nocardioides aurantiacus]ROR90091.1 glutamate transport system permease protein [Nocardioides aurantiacus]